MKGEWYGLFERVTSWGNTKNSSHINCVPLGISFKWYILMCPMETYIG